MSTVVSPHLAKNKLVKDLHGNIIDWYVEGNGGWIVRGREIVNEAKWNEIQEKKKDEILAAQAAAMAKVDDNAPDRSVSAKEGVENLKKASEQEKKVADLEVKVEAMDGKLDAILNALNKSNG
jgi:hypothetical protein